MLGAVIKNIAQCHYKGIIPEQNEIYFTILLSKLFEFCECEL